MNAGQYTIVTSAASGAGNYRATTKFSGHDIPPCTFAPVSHLHGVKDTPELRDAYEVKKRDILQAGLSEPVGYTKAKGDFINAVLAKQH